MYTMIYRALKSPSPGTWSGPWVTINGHRHFLSIVMEKDSVATTLDMPKILEL